MSNFNNSVTALIPQMRRYALSLTRNRHAADDLVQDALVRAMERRRQFVEGTNLRAWVFTIMHNIFVDQLRKAAPFKNPVPLDEYRLTQSVPAAQEPWMVLKELAAAVQRLPLEQRATLLLVGLEGLSYDEAAEVTGVAVGTIKSRLSRAREALRLATAAPEEEAEREPAETKHQFGGSERFLRRRARTGESGRGGGIGPVGSGGTGQIGKLPRSDCETARHLRSDLARSAS